MAEVAGWLYSSATYLSDLAEAVDSVVGINALAGSRVMVLGASGLIGSFVVDLLGMASAELELGTAVVACGRNGRRLRKRFSGSVWQEPSICEFDVVNGPGADAPPCDFVVHAASNAHPTAITSDPIGTIRANVDGVLSMFDWGVVRGMHRLLYVSSGEVYGQLPGRKDPLTEEIQGYVDPLAMRSCYPLAKRMAENICVSYGRQHGGECVVVRPCHAYGPTATQSDSRASSEFLAVAAAGHPVVLRSAGTQVRSYCYVADAASGALSALTMGEAASAYNVANPDSVVSVAEFAEISAHFGGVALVREGTGSSGRDDTPIERQVLDPSALMGLGWRPRFSVERGVEHTIAVAREARKC